MDNTIYYNRKMVCYTPTGSDVFIDLMPDFFLGDPFDHNKAHVHTFYEVIWFKEGGGVHTIDFQDYKIPANSLFFVAPGQIHHFNGIKRNQGLTVKFCSDFLEGNDKESVFVKFNVFNSKPYCTISDDETAGLSRIIQAIEDEKKTANKVGHSAMLKHLVHILLIYIHRHGVDKTDTSQIEMKPSHLLFVSFRNALENEYCHIHTVKEFANKLNVSTKTLSNSVLECSGKTPLELINSRILLESKRLLRFTDMMIKEIAYKMGFEDPSYFVKFFKRCTGHLPQDFRQRK